jgi:hypothetical protein
MIKGSIQEEAICLPNAGTSNCRKQILLDLKGEIAYNIMVVGDFSTLWWIDQTKKLTKKQQS